MAPDDALHLTELATLPTTNKQARASVAAHQRGSIFFDDNGDAAALLCLTGDLVGVGVGVRVEHRLVAVDPEEDGVPQVLVAGRELRERR